MKGHLRERSPGHWAVVLEIRDPESGRRKRKWHTFHGTKRQAQSECARLNRCAAGRHLPRTGQGYSRRAHGAVA